MATAEKAKRPAAAATANGAKFSAWDGARYIQTNSTAGPQRQGRSSAWEVRVGACVLGERRPRRNGGWWRMAPGRIADLQRLIEVRHGGVVDTDDLIDEYIAFYASHVRDIVGDPVASTLEWASMWCPRLSDCYVRAVVDCELSRPRRLTADSAAAFLHVTEAERQAARLTTIGSIEVSAERRKARRARAKAAAKAAARHAAGAKPRADSDARKKPWEALGVSRATFYRRKAAARARTTCETRETVSAHLPLIPRGAGSVSPSTTRRKAQLSLIVTDTDAHAEAKPKAAPNGGGAFAPSAVHHASASRPLTGAAPATRSPGAPTVVELQGAGLRRPDADSERDVIGTVASREHGMVLGIGAAPRPAMLGMASLAEATRLARWADVA